PSARLRAYRERLRSAEELLVASLGAEPAQAKTLAQLAAVRWELEAPLADEAAEAKHLRMLSVASDMAPSVPAVQLQIGTLLLKMGRRAEAEVYMRRAVDLDVGLASEVVDRLEENLYTAEEMLAALPRVPEVLIALQSRFFAEA